MTGNVPERTVAAFDFDGTLSTRDNFVPFLRRVAGTAAVSRAMALGSARHRRPPAAADRATSSRRMVLRDLFAGYDAEALDEIGRGFAYEIVQRHLRVRHRAAGRLAPHPGATSS